MIVTKLKIEIAKSGQLQYVIANKAKIHDSLLSLYVNGRRKISKNHLKALARALNVAQKDLVGEAT
jgi:transcriptional regulator with XRE-family HTH domain